MSRLFIRSMLVLALLFGLLFAVGIGVLYHFHFPMIYAAIFAVSMVSLQYAFGPFIIDWIFRIRWVKPEDVSPELAAFLTDLCANRKIPVPRFGIIEDGNPNAFTYGHVPGDARLVITRGLQEMLDEDELNAVVAHEVGHITHYDFVVMTIAAVVPMILYIVYRWTRSQRRGDAFAVSVGAYIVYIISEYIVLFLSRVREYFADEHAAESVASANAISSALIKIAYGLGRLPREEEKSENKDKKEKKQRQLDGHMVGSLGICSFNSANSLALYSSNAAGKYSPETMQKAMQWDLWNPWSKFFEIQCTHPLIARRVQAASKIASKLGQAPAFEDTTMPTQNLWRRFGIDFGVAFLPYLGLIPLISILVSTMLNQHTRFFATLKLMFTGPVSGLTGILLLVTGIGWLFRLAYSFKSNFKTATVAELVAEVEVSHINCIPVELEGEIIGRGVPGLFWSKDLILQDESGFIPVIYQQPLSILETLFGLFKAEQLIGRKGKFRGWYRRGPAPYLELRNATIDVRWMGQVEIAGEKMRCYRYWFLWGYASITALIGLWMVLSFK